MADSPAWMSLGLFNCRLIHPSEIGHSSSKEKKKQED